MRTQQILVVEDELLVAEDIRRKLLRIGYAVPSLAISAEEALRQVAELQPDLVLMDIGLSGARSGIDAADEIRDRFDIPVVYLTAHSDEQTLSQAKRTGPFGYVLKPFETRDLRSTLEMALYKHAQEKKLRESEARYRSLFDSVPVGLYRTTPDGEILDANPALVEMLGYPDRETLLDMNVLDGYALATDRARWQAAVEREKAIGEFETPMRRHDGTIIWVRDSARAARDAEGRVLHYDGFMEDITERKRAEEALWESKQLLEKVFTSQLDAIFVVDADTVEIIDCNPATSEVFGYDRDEMLGRTTSILHIDEAALERFRAHLYPAVEEKGFLHLREFRMKRKDGTTFPTEHSVAPLEDELGQRFGWVSVVRDITERKRAEETLRRSERRFRTLATLAPVGIYLTDARGTCRYVNRCWLEMAGLSLDEALGDGWKQGLHPEDRQPVAEAWYETCAAGAPWAQEYRFRDEASGRVTWVYGLATPQLNDDGQIVGYVGVNLDITERKRAEQALRRSLAETERGQEMLLGLAQAAEAVQRTRTRADVLQAIGDEMANLGYQITLFTLTEDQAHLTLAHHTLEGTVVRAAEKLTGLSARGYRYPLTPDNYYYRVLSDGKPVADDRAAHAIGDALPHPFRALAGRLATVLGIRQAIYVPLRIRGEPTGLMTVIGEELSESDLPAITAFANQASIALENAQLFEQVHAARERLESLSRRLLDTQETERRRLARELHDQIGQALTVLKINLQAAQRSAADETASQLEGSLHTLASTLEQVRSLSLDLRPSLLDDLGLVPALRWYLDRQAQQGGFRTQFRSALDERLPPEVEIACFRIVQEALTNVMRHAEAGQVEVELQHRGDALRLSIRDDGQGFEVSKARAGAAKGESMGLLSMEERVQLLGGQIGFESMPGRGTKIEISLPVPERAGTRASEECVS